MSSVGDESGRRRLGRGLAALIGDAGSEFEVVERVRGIRKVAIDLIKANPRNPRRLFKEEDLEELAGYKYDPEVYARRVRDREGWSELSDDADD